jgi:hypothetical protein
MVLENLGWSIVRVWSPDWWYDAESAIKTIDQQLTELLTESRNCEPSNPTVDPEPVISPDTQSIEAGPNQTFAIEDDNEVDVDAASDGAVESKVFYERVKLTDAVGNQNRFYESEYDDDLRQMALAILKNEAPIRDDVLAKQIARAHGFARTGNNIRSRILDLLGDVVSTDESTGRFLWSSDEPTSIVEFRPARSEEDRRSVDEISLAELAGLIQSESGLLSETDPPVAIARSIGLARLSQSARERIEEAIRSIHE